MKKTIVQASHGESTMEVQYADFQEAQEALAPVYDSGLNL